MKLIVGLGNTGIRYEHTRHNLGFLVLDKFLKDFSQVQKSIWEESRKFKSDIFQIEWQRRSLRRSSGQALSEKVILVKPHTYMNNSGLAVSLIISFYKISSTEILIIHDEVDLPLGTMKIRFGGSAAGHKGVSSIIEKLGTDKFWRLRLGVGHPRFSTKNKSLKIKYRSVDKFILGEFNRSEAGKARELIKRGSKAISEVLENGLEKAMNRFNTK